MSEGEPNDESSKSEEPAEAADATAPEKPSPAVPVGDEEGIGQAPDAVFNALWARVLDAWEDDKPHQRALSYALEHEMLPEIAGRYRKLADDPEKGPRAKKKIDAIVLAATQLLLATKTPPREKIPWTWTASVAIVMILVIAFLAYKLFAHH